MRHSCNGHPQPGFSGTPPATDGLGSTTAPDGKSGEWYVGEASEQDELGFLGLEESTA